MKLAPLRVTVVPLTPLVGVKLVITGAEPVTVKLLPVVLLPEGEITCNRIIAGGNGDGTVAEICVSPVPVIENEAVLAPNLTEVAPVKFVPSIVTGVTRRTQHGIEIADHRRRAVGEFVGRGKLAVPAVTVIVPVPGLLVRSTCKLVSL